MSGRDRRPLAVPRELLALAIHALGHYKLRTALSVLGVVLGVAAVIAMMSVSEGAREDALEQMQRLGLDNIVARSRLPSSMPTSASLTVGDAARLIDLVPLAGAVSPVLTRYTQIAHRGSLETATLLGVHSSYQAILGLSVAAGRWLSVLDEREGARVCVLGGPLARKLFGPRASIGEAVAVQGEYYRVVGVLADRTVDGRSSGALAGRDLDFVAFAPLSALSGRATGMASGVAVDEIWLQARDGDQVEQVGRVFTHTLARLKGGSADFEILIPKELLAQRYRTQRTFTVVVGSVAVLALIVGGIGIMNSMLTSVMERTREIGVRRAVGATRRDVGLQFLTESLMMTLGGGVLGILIGVGVSWGITAYASWSTSVSVQAVLLGFFVSATVGLVFGLYPAVKAAQLEPVEALHYE
jgi:putative ABC transport system permease protein